MNKVDAKLKSLINWIFVEPTIINSNDETRDEAKVYLKEHIQSIINEVSREVAVDFELRHTTGNSKAAKKLAYMQFNKWQQKQKER